jgi:multisubunit Na+/H+ antiporter MnhC subunit
MIGIALLYFPLSQTRVSGEAAKEIFSQIDYIGGITSIGGLTLFLVAMQAGGYSHPWSSAYVLATMIIGFALLAIFVVWEWKYAKMPMVPREMFGE